MFTKEWLSAFIQLLVLIPSALSCYLPAKNRLKLSMLKLSALCCAVLIPFSAICALVLAAHDLPTNTVLLPALLTFFFVFRATVKLDLPKTLAIYVGVCAVQTFPAQFGNLAEVYFPTSPDNINLISDFICLGLSCLVAVIFIYPARGIFYRMVDELEVPGVWYAVTALSAIFLIFNIIAAPGSYEAFREGRLLYLFPALELGALAVLVTIYVLFYLGSSVIVKHEKLEKRAQLLEMQSHQFRELQEYMRQTARLRHDFKHSVHLLSALAENGDLDSIRAHLSEYDRRLSENVSVSYCKNAALNALFGYYREMAYSENIRTDWRIELPEPLTVSELDLAALFGNIMENAISACAALPEGERYFNLTAELRHGNSLYVVSTNSFDGKVIKGRDGYRSTKHSGRGTGLISIAAVAEKYGGSAQFRNSDKEFYADVVMKI